MYSVKYADVGTPTGLGQEINHSQRAIKTFNFVFSLKKKGKESDCYLKHSFA